MTNPADQSRDMIAKMPLQLKVAELERRVAALEQNPRTVIATDWGFHRGNFWQEFRKTMSEFFRSTK